MTVTDLLLLLLLVFLVLVLLLLLLLFLVLVFVFVLVILLVLLVLILILLVLLPLLNLFYSPVTSVSPHSSSWCSCSCPCCSPFLLLLPCLPFYLHLILILHHPYLISLSLSSPCSSFPSSSPGEPGWLSGSAHSTVNRCVVGSSPTRRTEHFGFPPVLRDWLREGPGMSSLVYATGHIKDPVPLIEKRRGLSPSGRFPPSFIHQVIIITGLNKLQLYVLALKMTSDADWA